VATSAVAVPASIRYMIEKVEDENEFNRLALENVVTQGAKSAYLYLLPKPLKCDRDEQFKCPEKLELAAKYTNNKIRVYDKKDRPVVTKKEGFAAKFLQHRNIRKFNENCDKPYYVEFSTGCVTFTDVCSYVFDISLWQWGL
jgi:hypothetical protein